NQASLCSFFFQERVRADRRAVTKKGDVSCQRALINQLFDAIQHSLKRLLGSRRDFGDADRAGIFIEKNKIGECSASVDGNAVLRHRSFVYHQKDRSSIILRSGRDASLRSA